MAESIKVPGFRKGKVPIPVIVARVGKEAIAEEAVRGHIEGWFWDAATTAGVRPVAGPEVEWDALPAQGDTFSFVATVPVAPKPKLADWTTLEVPRPEPELPSDVIDAELERIRDSVAELVPVEGRPVAEGDTVVLDLVAAGAGRRAVRAPGLRGRARHRLSGRRARGRRSRNGSGRHEGGLARARRGLPGRDGDGHRQGDQGEGPAGARRRARQGCQRVRDAGGAPDGYRGEARRAAGGRARRALPRGRRSTRSPRRPRSRGSSRSSSGAPPRS